MTANIGFRVWPSKESIVRSATVELCLRESRVVDESAILAATAPNSRASTDRT